MEKKEPGWKAGYEAKKEQMKAWLQEFSKYQQDPQQIMEFLEFGSRFYHYSLRNTQLIYQQNPNATFVQSYSAWKQMGVSVKGQKGIRVYVPKYVTYLMIDQQEAVQLKLATAEQRAAYQRGEIQWKQILTYGIGNVFDISQTNFPKEQYPALFQMGRNSEEHGRWIEVLTAFAEEELYCRVTDQDMESISLRGFYRYKEDSKEIVLNHLLNDTEKLSTLSHEIRHGVTYQEEMDRAEAELRADMISMMLQWNMGIEVTESRKRHFQVHYQIVWKGFGDHAEEKMDHLLEQVFQTYKRINEKLELYQSMSQKADRKEQKYGREYKKKCGSCTVSFIRLRRL